MHSTVGVDYFVSSFRYFILISSFFLMIWCSNKSKLFARMDNRLQHKSWNIVPVVLELHTWRKCSYLNFAKNRNIRSLCLTSNNMLRLMRCSLCCYRILNSFPELVSRRSHRKWLSLCQVLGKKVDDSNLSALFVPVPVKPTSDDINVGTELTGSLNKNDLVKVLNRFQQHQDVKVILAENGFDSTYGFCY